MFVANVTQLCKDLVLPQIIRINSWQGRLELKLIGWARTHWNPPNSQWRYFSTPLNKDDLSGCYGNCFILTPKSCTTSFWPTLTSNHTGKGILWNLMPSVTKLTKTQFSLLLKTEANILSNLFFLFCLKLFLTEV